MFSVAMSGVYTVINVILAVVIFLKSPKTFLTRFYVGCVVSLSFLGLAAFFIGHLEQSLFRTLLLYAVLFVYAVFPFLFMHFIAIFVHRVEIVRSRAILISIYATGVFAFFMMLLHHLPSPISPEGQIAQSGYVYYFTWMSIFFSIGIAILYDSYRKYRDVGMKTNILFISFMVLLLLLPGPFTESLVFGVAHISAEGYFYICTLGLMIGVYFIFRYRILVNTMYDAMKLALGVMNDLLITTDENFRITLARGRAVSSLLGYQESDLFGKELSELVVEKEYLRNYRKFVLNGKMKESYFDTDVVGKTGIRYPMNFSFTPLYIEEELTGFVGVGRDMRERKKLEEELRQAQKMESLGTLAGGIAHDFNNILQIILMNTLALAHKNTTPEKIDHIMEINKNAVQRGASLVQQILTFARKSEVHFVTLQLNPLVQDLVKMLSETLPRTINLSVRLEEKLPAIHADQNQLHQVLINLCLNARDAMPEGGSIVIGSGVVAGAELQNRYPNAANGPYVHLSITDSGHGMDESVRSKIFEPFFTTKGQNKGTGLGLAVVYGIVSTHHGFIDVESAVGKGTTFHIYLPVSSQVDVDHRKSGAPKEVPRRGSETILVVEDEEFLRETLCSLLKESGYTVFTAEDGYDAISVFYRHRPEIDLVITDIGLPRLNGWDAFIKMRETKPGLKAIISSGYLDPDAKSESKEVEAFILKPFNPADILRTVRNVLDKQFHTPPISNN